MENWIFDRKSTAADLPKMVKILNYLKICYEIFFGNFICSTHQKKLFYKLSGSFRKIEFLTENLQPRTLQKWWKFCTISKCTQNVLRKYFSAKLFVPLIKRSVSTIFKAVFGKLNFWLKIHSRGPYKNGDNFVLSQNVLRKYFLAKFFVPLIKRSVSTNFKAVFGKLNFWQKIHSRGPYKNGENFVLSQNRLRKYFFAKFFVPLIKRSVSTNFKAGFGKLNFWWKIHSRGPYKNGENFVLSENVLRKYFLAKFFVPLIKRSVSTNFKAVVKKIEFLTENPQPRTLQKWWKFCTISKCAKKIFFGKILCSTHQKKCFYKF